jgi:Uma2 family endonuclease
MGKKGSTSLASLSTQTRYSEAECWALENQPIAYRFEILSDGRLLLQAEETGGEAMASPRHGALCAKLIIALGNYLQATAWGTVYTGDTAFVLAGTPDDIRLLRRPDVAVVRAERVQHHTRGYYYLAPDLAVEVISPNERPSHVARKVHDYRRHGVALIWLVYPETQEVVAYAGEDIYIYEGEDTLTGGDLLADFRLPLAELFRP